MSNYILWLRHLGRKVKLLKEEAITIVTTSWLSRIKLTGHHWRTLLIVITKGLTPPVFGLFVKNIPANYTSHFYNRGHTMKRTSKRRTWTTADVRELKSLARKKTPTKKIARTLKRSEGATRQKALSIGLSLDTRA